jgi:hypothetical protein
VWVTAGSGAEQLSGLTAKLVKIRSVGKPRHDVSSAPGLAFRRDKKTILPGKHDVTSIMEVDAVLPASPAAPSNAVRQAYPTLGDGRHGGTGDAGRKIKISLRESGRCRCRCPGVRRP